MNPKQHMKTKPPSQSAQILAWLESGKTITGMEALDQIGCFRLAARIKDLKNDGYDIRTETVPTPSGAPIARYSLARPVRFIQPQLFAYA